MTTYTTAQHMSGDNACNPHSWTERLRRAGVDLYEGAALWRLCLTLGWLDIKLRYRGSALGPFWLTLSTGIMVGAMGFLYSTLFRIELHDYLPFLALSLVLWSFITGLVNEASTCFVQVEGIIRSVRLPYTLHAARAIIRNFLVLAHNIPVILVVFAIFNVWPSFLTALLILPALVLWAFDSLALMLIFGMVGARFRDMPPIIASIMQIAFFLSPIIWRPDLLAGKQISGILATDLLPFNPFFVLMEIVRGPLLGQIPSAAIWGAALIHSLVLCAAAGWLFVRARNRIAYWI